MLKTSGKYSADDICEVDIRRGMQIDGRKGKATEEEDIMKQRGDKIGTCGGRRHLQRQPLRRIF